MSERSTKMTAVKGNALRKEPNLDSMHQGRVQPQATELEEAVIGAILVDKEALTMVNDTLMVESFYKNANGIIYDVALDLFNRQIPVDLLSVFEELRKRKQIDEIGGMAYLAQLSNRVSSSANAEYCARIIQQKHILRELIRGSAVTIDDSFDDTKDVFDILDDAEKLIYDISQANLRKGVQDAGRIAGALLKEINELAAHDGDVTGITSGFDKLDELTNGWQKSDLIIIAARPAMGKTSFVLNLARNAAMLQKAPVMVFSLEMSNPQLVQRLLSTDAEIPLTKIRKGDIHGDEWQVLTDSVQRLAEMPVYVDDTPGITVAEMRSKCRRLKNEKDLGLVVIDYLQLMSGSANKGGNREQEISQISRSLKGMAKELNVPVIALSQLSRAVETRGGSKRPILSDLRESGAIEQDADIVTFLYRPEYYDDQDSEDTYQEEGETEIIIAKHRNGPLGSVFLKFLKEFTKFVPKSESLFGNSDIQSPYNPGITVTRPSKLNDLSSDSSNDAIPF